MASVVDICNLGLGHVGDEATVSSISPSDGSAQADHCVRFYPIARDLCLAMHAWSFNTRRKAGALVSNAEQPTSWVYTYQVPNEAINVISVLPEGYTDDIDDGVEFVQEQLSTGERVIYTDSENVTLRYNVLVTDTTKYTPGFVAMVARLLASYLAGPIIKGEAGMKVAQAHFSVFEKVEAPRAMALDQKGRRSTKYADFIPSGIAARQ